MNRYNSFFLLLLLLLSQCSENKILKEKTTLETNQLLWSSMKIENYRITQSMTCYCPRNFVEPNVIEVRNGKIVSVNGEVNIQEYMPFKTMDDFFEFIDRKLGSNPFAAMIQYDKKYGFPRDFYFDMNEMMMDEEVGYTLTDFTILE